MKNTYRKIFMNKNNLLLLASLIVFLCNQSMAMDSQNSAAPVTNSAAAVTQRIIYRKSPRNSSKSDEQKYEYDSDETDDSNVNLRHTSLSVQHTLPQGGLVRTTPLNNLLTATRRPRFPSFPPERTLTGFNLPDQIDFFIETSKENKIDATKHNIQNLDQNLKELIIATSRATSYDRDLRTFVLKFKTIQEKLLEVNERLKKISASPSTTAGTSNSSPNAAEESVATTTEVTSASHSTTASTSKPSLGVFTSTETSSSTTTKAKEPKKEHLLYAFLTAKEYNLSHVLYGTLFGSICAHLWHKPEHRKFISQPVQAFANGSAMLIGFFFKKLFNKTSPIAE
jgi:hypothetical protein